MDTPAQYDRSEKIVQAGDKRQPFASWGKNDYPA